MGEELLGVSLYKKLLFDKHLQLLFKDVNQKENVAAGISDFKETNQLAKLMNTSMMS